MQKGFTITELLIAIAIVMILAAAAISISGNLQVLSQLNENSALISQTLKQARQNSVSGLDNRRHGVKFFSDRYIMYEGADYASRYGNYDRITGLDPSMVISTDLPNQEVNFSRGLGEPNATGTVTLLHDTGEERKIFINSLGIIGENH
jgi:prepilin-type N-terminal cleavage/methylation domain-containing protein